MTSPRIRLDSIGAGRIGPLVFNQTTDTLVLDAGTEFVSDNPIFRYSTQSTDVKMTIEADSTNNCLIEFKNDTYTSNITWDDDQLTLNNIDNFFFDAAHLINVGQISVNNYVSAGTYVEADKLEARETIELSTQDSGDFNNYDYNTANVGFTSKGIITHTVNAAVYLNANSSWRNDRYKTLTISNFRAITGFVAVSSYHRDSGTGDRVCGAELDQLTNNATNCVARCHAWFEYIQNAVFTVILFGYAIDPTTAVGDPVFT